MGPADPLDSFSLGLRKDTRWYPSADNLDSMPDEYAAAVIEKAKTHPRLYEIMSQAA